MNPKRALAALGAVLAAFAVTVGVSAAGSLTAGPLVQVSGASPIAGCTADAGQSGTVFVGSEVEPWIDVNPTNPQNLVGIWQQDRWSNGGARAHGYAASFDGGGTWTTGLIPGLTKCSGGVYDRATDPWVTFAPNGHVYQLALVFNDANFDHGLLVSKSTNGGKTWGKPQFVIRDTDGNVFNDKQTVTADPTSANHVYAVWDRLVFPVEMASDRAFVAFGGRGPTWFARTTNGGKTWEPAHQIFDAGQESQTIGNQIVVSNRTLVNGMNLIYYFRNNEGIRGHNVAVIRSTDRGATWSSNAIIVSKLGTIEIHDPETGEYIRTGDIIPDFAVDPTNGDVYAVWQDARFNGGQADAIALSRSRDAGLTWSAPIQVNDTPTNIPIGDQQAFTPSVHVASDGTVAVTYYDFRNNTSDASTLPTDYFAVHCHSACATASSWGEELRLTNASFDMRKAPLAIGFFTGDYEGLTAAGTTFGAFWSMTHGSDSGSVFFRRAAP